MAKLEQLLEGVDPGTAIRFRNLELIPLTRSDGTPAPVEYVLAAEALAKELLTVTEIDAHGSVPELLAINLADTAVFILHGDELIGAKQNRILNTDVLLRANSKKKIPVSCVEQGRWHHVSDKFAAGQHTPPKMRAKMSKVVGRNLKQNMMAAADQGEVWSDVSDYLGEVEAASPTAAMADAYTKMNDELHDLEKVASCPENAVGVLALMDGGFLAVDLFDRHKTLEAAWARLVRGYAMEVFRKGKQSESGKASDGRKLIDRLRQVECEPCAGVDLGEDWRFDSEDLVGSALVVEGRALHLSAFPG